MEAYIYQAAMLCADCAHVIQDRLGSSDAHESQDSADYPQGPYDDGGGESDVPEHCDKCQVFLENPLTEDGGEYVREAWEEHQATNAGAVVQQWRAFYDYLWD